MNKILELREKRTKAWETAKNKSRKACVAAMEEKLKEEINKL